MNSTLYYNGPILTMESPSDSPEAILMKDGKIAALGSRNDLRSFTDSQTIEIDLNGRTLMPAFIDSHSHFSGYASSLLQVSLEEASSFEEIILLLKSFIRENHIAPGEWVVGNGYDHNFLREHTHPRKEILDQVSCDHPIVIQHASGHVGVFNSCALRILGITKDTLSPSGGMLELINGTPSGYMEENAFISFYQKAPLMPSSQKLMKAFQTVQHRYASYGITTIQEGFFAPQLIPIYKQLQKEELLKLDVVGYPDWKTGNEVFESFPNSRNAYDRHLKLRGCKMFLDGSPQGRTAWMRRPYQNDETYRGYNTMDSCDVQAACKKALEENMQILAHCNGDAAAAQYLHCYEEALHTWKAAHPGSCPPDIRPVIIHAQLLAPDQIPKVKELHMIPSFFIAHIYHWGDIHLKNFGPKRASCLSPAGSALHAGIPFTFHQDAPVIPPDMPETLWCATTRQTRNGILLGTDECIPTWEALKAVTIYPAYQYGEESLKGTLAPGKQADYIILDQNPLTIPHQKLKDLNILETWKDGHRIYP